MAVHVALGALSVNADSPAPKALMMADIYTLDSVTEDGLLLGALGRPSISADGKATFLAQPYDQNDGFPRILVSSGPGVVPDIVRTQSPAPGVDGAAFRTIGGVQVRGHATAFMSILEGPGVTGPNSQSIWLVGPSQTPQLLMRTGVPIAGLESGVTFPPLLAFEPYNEVWAVLYSAIDRFRFSRAGQAAFSSALVGPGVDQSDHGIFVATVNGVSTIARYGDAAPGYAPGVTFNWLAYPSINDHGDVAFLGFVHGEPNGGGIWMGSIGHPPEPVVKFGDAVANLGPGNWFSGIGKPRINNAGQVAFIGFLNATPMSAVVAGSAGALKVIAKNGDQVPGAESGVVFERLGMMSAESHEPIINGSGMVAFASLLAGPTVNEGNDTALFAQDRQGVLRLVAREGEEAPGGGTFGDLGIFSFEMNFNASSQLAFFASLTKSEPNAIAVEGIWALDRRGTLQTIVRTDEPFEFQGPNGSEQAEIGALAFQPNSDGKDGWNANLNDAGQIAFWASRPSFRYSIFRSDAVAIPEPGTVAMMVFFAVMAGRMGPWLETNKAIVSRS